MNLYKIEYPILLSLEFVAVQIIAVDTVRKSGLHIAGYLMNVGHFPKNNVSTGDLNRGRRACRLLETWSPCSHPFAILPVSAVSDAQKLATGNFLHVRARAFCVTFCTPQKVTSRLPFGNFPLHGKHAPVGAARYACFYSLAGSFRGFPAAYGGYPCCFRNNRLPLRGISRGVGAPPLPVHAKRVCCLLRKQTKKKQKPRFLGFCFFGSMIFLIRLLRSFSPCQILLQFPQTALP